MRKISKDELKALATITQDTGRPSQHFARPCGVKNVDQPDKRARVEALEGAAELIPAEHRKLASGAADGLEGMEGAALGMEGIAIANKFALPSKTNEDAATVRLVGIKIDESFVDKENDFAR